MPVEISRFQVAIDLIARHRDRIFDLEDQFVLMDEEVIPDHFLTPAAKIDKRLLYRYDVLIG